MAKRGPKPDTVHDIDRAARILAAAHVFGPKRAAAQSGTTQASIKRWKAAMKSRPDLQEAFARALRIHEGRWREALAQSSVRAAESLYELLDYCRQARVQLMEAKDIDNLLTVMGLERGIANDLLEHATEGEGLMGPAGE